MKSMKSMNLFGIRSFVMMKDSRASTGKVRIEKVARPRRSTRRRPSSTVTRVTTIVCSSSKSTSTTRRRSASTTPSVRVNKIQRRSSEDRSIETTSQSSRREKRSRSNQVEQQSVVHLAPDEVSGQSASSTRPIRKWSRGLIRDADEHHRSTNKKKKKLCRCSRRRVLLSLIISILLVLLIIAIVLLVLFLKSKPTTSRSFDRPAYLRWNATGVTLYGTVGVRGNTSTTFSSPFGILIDSLENLYIADRYNHRVQGCSLRLSNCTTFAGQGNGVAGTNLSSLNGPTYLYLDDQNRFYIADSGNQRVLLWPVNAASGSPIAGTLASAGSALNQFNIPYGIALDSTTSSVYIADHNNHRVMKYPSGSSTGTVVAGGNGLGTNRSQLFRPAGLHFDAPSNSLIIVNFGGSNIVRWKLGEFNWTSYLGDPNGTNGNTTVLLDHPTSMTFDPMGNVYVADMFNHRIVMFNRGETNGTVIAGLSGRLGTTANLLNYPVAVAFDHQLNLYVSDSLNHRIQKFLRY